MNQNKYPVNNYVPYNPDNLTGCGFGRSLGESLDRQKYEKITENPQYHLSNCYVTNFDLIHHECRGDKLENSKKYYETICKKAVNKEIKEHEQKTYFVSEATEHFHKLKMEQKLEHQSVFLSSMKKRAFNEKKNTRTTVNLCLFRYFFIFLAH